jgi:SAM-dependent methyltransferase
MSHAFSGSGPGIQTPDGCSVEVYRQLPYLGELDEVVGLLHPGSALLELGCGTGRLCGHLARLGFRVTGVDESSDMLSALPHDVIAVQSTIQSLSLPTRFDTVLLASHLINHPEARCREAFVACAHRHLKRGGRFLLQRHDPEWLRRAEPGPAGRAGRLAIHVEAVSREEGAVRMSLRYEHSGQTWRQSFAAVPLSVQEIEDLLGRFGFDTIHWFGRSKLWASAVAQ